MKKITRLLLMCLAFVGPVHAAKKLNLKDLCNGTYYAQRIYGVNPMNDGESYSQLGNGNKQILKYSFRTGEQTGVLFDVATAEKVKLDNIDGYIMSPDEKNILVRTKTHSIYRHSHTAVYYIYNVANRTLAPLSEGGPQQVPMFSRDGNMIAFVRENNLFLVKLLYNNSESQITKDGKFNEVINGIPDWVNEEEFANDCSFDFNADNTMLAWVKYDESKVPLFSFPLFRGASPTREAYTNYPGAYEYKYPIAGETNATVTVHSFEIKTRVERKMNLPLPADGYIPRIKFTNDPNKLAIYTLNRHQDNLEIYMANPRSTECKMVLRDKAAKYISDKAYSNVDFYGNYFVLQSERDGFNHLYLYNTNGSLVKQVTKGQFNVTAFYGYDEATGAFYYESNQDSPMQTAVYCTAANGKTTKLTPELGQNSAIFSKNFKYFMNVYSNINTPYVTALFNNKGKQLKVLVDNKELKQKLADLDLGKREFFKFKTSEGIELNGYMVKPADFNPNKKYPVILFQYSGPGSQQVLDSWAAGNMGGTLYEQYMAGEGFIMVCVDGRGTGGRGRDFEQCTYLNLGDLESKDQVETAIYLGSLPYVDKNNIGIWGWSFGGFNTLMSMSEGRPVFAAGVAVAPPTSWRFYDTVYTERFMRTPKENPTGYDRNPMSRAGQLHGALLICHGMADDNVHFRNVAEYAESLVQADKPFMMLPYTNRNHGIYGGNTRNHLFTAISNFFIRELK